MIENCKSNGSFQSNVSSIKRTRRNSKILKFELSRTKTTSRKRKKKKGNARQEERERERERERECVCVCVCVCVSTCSTGAVAAVAALRQPTSNEIIDDQRKGDERVVVRVYAFVLTFFGVYTYTSYKKLNLCLQKKV